jgi:hypothetical protein
MGGNRASAATKMALLVDRAKSRFRLRWPQRVINDLRCVFESVKAPSLDDGLTDDKNAIGRGRDDRR